MVLKANKLKEEGKLSAADLKAKVPEVTLVEALRAGFKQEELNEVPGL